MPPRLADRVTGVVVAIDLVSWPPVARLVRAEFMSLRHREYVEAVRLVGQTNRTSHHLDADHPDRRRVQRHPAAR